MPTKTVIEPAIQASVHSGVSGRGFHRGFLSSIPATVALANAAVFTLQPLHAFNGWVEEDFTVGSLSSISSDQTPVFNVLLQRLCSMLNSSGRIRTCIRSFYLAALPTSWRTLELPFVDIFQARLERRSHPGPLQRWESRPLVEGYEPSPDTHQPTASKYPARRSGSLLRSKRRW